MFFTDFSRVFHGCFHGCFRADFVSGFTAALADLGPGVGTWDWDPGPALWAQGRGLVPGPRPLGPEAEAWEWVAGTLCVGLVPGP